MGGRKPKSTTYLSPEDEEKRRVRRERNKLAAARCRKRRVDQTNTLTDLVEKLLAEKSQLKSEVDALKLEEKDLVYVLQTHGPQCKITVSAVVGAIDNADKIVAKQKIEFKESTVTPMVDKIKVEVDDPGYEEREMAEPPPLKRVLLSTANPVFGAASNSVTIAPLKPSRPR